MNYLTVPQVLFIHARLLAETGGASGIRDLALLESAVARPQATFDGADLYPDSLTKAAALNPTVATTASRSPKPPSLLPHSVRRHS